VHGLSIPSLLIYYVCDDFFWSIFVSISIKTLISWADIYFFAYYFGYHTCVIYRVNQLVIKHLSTQGKLDPRGEFHCFLYPNKT